MTRLRSRRLLVVSALVSTLVAGSFVGAPADSASATFSCGYQRLPLKEMSVERLAGTDRYETAVAISQAIFQERPCELIIASGTAFPDALAGAAWATWDISKPVLLVHRDFVPASVKAEIKRLRPQSITVVGGYSVVSKAVIQELEPLATFGVQWRRAGVDRYDTAVQVSELAPSGGTLYVASGEQFPDALTGAPMVGPRYSTMLLVPRDGIPSTVREALLKRKPSSIVVLGGPGAVSDRVLRDLRTYTRGSVTRISGADRYATAVAISQHFEPAGAYTVFIASGRSYPDALAGAPLASGSGSPILLVEPDAIPPVVQRELTRLKPTQIVVLGGTGVVSRNVELQLRAYLHPYD